VETRRSVEYEEWQAACRVEREAWGNVTGKLPGSPGHDHDAWIHWQEALQRSTDALDRYLKSRNELRWEIQRRFPPTR
jgi:hypothetical protein